MKRLAAAAIAAGLAAAAPAAELSAAEVAARNAAARGGLDAWRKVETMVWSGRIESARAPAGTRFELEQKRPNKTRLTVDALGKRSLRVFDGAHGWKIRPASGRPQVEPYTPLELRYAQAGHAIDGPLIDYAARGDSVTLQGLDEIGGRRAYHLALRQAKGGREDVWVDAETWLDIRHDRMADVPGGAPRRVSATYGDYRSVEGLQIPFLITTGSGPGATPDRMQIETVTLNAPLDDSAFGSPAAPRPRDRAGPGAAARGRPPAAPWAAPAAATDQRGSASP